MNNYLQDLNARLAAGLARLPEALRQRQARNTSHPGRIPTAASPGAMANPISTTPASPCAAWRCSTP